MAALTDEFRRISLAGIDIIANCKNRLFVEEVYDWADGMMAFGNAGAQRVLSERHAAKPFSEGIVLSSRVLAPYLDKAEAALRKVAEE